jgi:hypothetical protein
VAAVVKFDGAIEALQSDDACVDRNTRCIPAPCHCLHLTPHTEGKVDAHIMVYILLVYSYNK